MYLAQTPVLCTTSITQTQNRTKQRSVYTYILDLVQINNPPLQSAPLPSQLSSPAKYAHNHPPGYDLDHSYFTIKIKNFSYFGVFLLCFVLFFCYYFFHFFSQFRFLCFCCSLSLSLPINKSHSYVLYLGHPSVLHKAQKSY